MGFHIEIPCLLLPNIERHFVRRHNVTSEGKDTRDRNVPRLKRNELSNFETIILPKQSIIICVEYRWTFVNTFFSHIVFALFFQSIPCNKIRIFIDHFHFIMAHIFCPIFLFRTSNFKFLFKKNNIKMID